MEEKDLIEIDSLLLEAEKDLDNGDIEAAKAKLATARRKVVLPGTGSNGLPQLG